MNNTILGIIIALIFFVIILILIFVVLGPNIGYNIKIFALNNVP